MDESRCAPPEKRNRAKSGGLRRASRERGGLGYLPFRFPDGPARGGGAGADSAGGGAFQRGLADMDRNDCGDGGGGRGGAVFFQRYLTHSAASVLCCDERDSDARGVSVGAHGFA